MASMTASAPVSTSVGAASAALQQVSVAISDSDIIHKLYACGSFMEPAYLSFIEYGCFFSLPLMGTMGGRELTYGVIKHQFLGISEDLYGLTIRYIRFLYEREQLVVLSTDGMRRVFKVIRYSRERDHPFGLEIFSSYPVSESWSQVDRLAKIVERDVSNTKMIAALGGYNIHRYERVMSTNLFVVFNTDSRCLESWKVQVNPAGTAVNSIVRRKLRNIQLTPEEIIYFMEHIESEESHVPSLLFEKIEHFNVLAHDARHTIEKDSRIPLINPLSWDDQKKVYELIRSGNLTMTQKIGSIESISLTENGNIEFLFDLSGEMITSA